MTQRESRAAELTVLVFEMCQLRRGPDDMPHSKALFALLVGASTLLDVVVGAFGDGVSDSLSRSLFSTCLVLALCWIALALRHLGNRYLQTASALVACSVVFSLLILPLAWLSGPVPAPPAELTPMQMLLGWVTLAIVAWNLVVNAHIVRRALDAPFALGLALVLAWFVADLTLERVLFDAVPG
ncbi:MAG TPA: hypothetical protein VGO25_12590 [Rhodanobacteraceae bacterium]|jgi:hypothetical protein|nr:hypothetical protein [Rhodanobacteraceae bacterium]